MVVTPLPTPQLSGENNSCYQGTEPPRGGLPSGREPLKEVRSKREEGIPKGGGLLLIEDGVRAGIVVHLHLLIHFHVLAACSYVVEQLVDG